MSWFDDSRERFESFCASCGVVQRGHFHRADQLAFTDDPFRFGVIIVHCTEHECLAVTRHVPTRDQTIEAGRRRDARLLAANLRKLPAALARPLPRP